MIIHCSFLIPNIPVFRRLKCGCPTQRCQRVTFVIALSCPRIAAEVLSVWVFLLSVWVFPSDRPEFSLWNLRTFTTELLPWVLLQIPVQVLISHLWMVSFNSLGLGYNDVLIHHLRSSCGFSELDPSLSNGFRILYEREVGCFAHAFKIQYNTQFSHFLYRYHLKWGIKMETVAKAAP